MLNITLKAADAKAFEKKLTEAFGRRVEEVFEALHEELLASTPMNSGRTLGSWAASRSAPEIVDIGPRERVPGTNDLPVGAEPGRDEFENMSRETRDKLHIPDQPFDTFLISNGAELDSEFNSALAQTPGSRAYYQEIGDVPGFNPWGPEPFDRRGLGMTRLAVEKTREEFKKL